MMERNEIVEGRGIILSVDSDGILLLAKKTEKLTVKIDPKTLNKLKKLKGKNVRVLIFGDRIHWHIIEGHHLSNRGDIY